MTNKSPSIIETFKSIAAAFFGVQSNKNREKDFAHGKLSHFLVVGIVCLVIFIVLLILVVNIVLSFT